MRAKSLSLISRIYAEGIAMTKRENIISYDSNGAFKVYDLIDPALPEQNIVDV